MKWLSKVQVMQVRHNVNGKQFEDPEKHTIQTPEEWTASSCWGLRRFGAGGVHVTRPGALAVIFLHK